MRKIWATYEAMPFSQSTFDSASQAGASEIIALPCPALPSLTEGYHEIDDNPVPAIISPRQARLALSAAGLLSTINGAVAAADEATQIAWDYATEIRRDNPLIAAVAAALNPPLTSEQIDDLFRNAASY